MTMVGFNFTGIHAERKSVAERNIRIENNVGITNVSEATVGDPKKSLLRFEFNFKCKYEPELGVIELRGELIEIYDKDYAQQIIDTWKNEKKVLSDVMPIILNTVLNKANIEAIVISKELGLPSPIALPKVELKHRTEEKQQDAMPKSEPVKAEAKKKK
jgi:hypothetical protein